MPSEPRNDVPLGRRSPMAQTRVVVADRNVITRVGIRAILERTAGTAVIAEATTYEATLDAVDEHGPDVLVIDLDLGDDTTRGLKLCEEISERFSHTKILVLASTMSEMIVVEALRRGATGYLVKDNVKADELGKAVRSVQEGETVLGKGVGSLVSRGLGSVRTASSHLSDRELDVIRLVAKGLSNKEIAHDMFISESTVKFHLQNASKKLGAHRRAEIVHRANAEGLL
jgi:two-component system response regulator DevR